MTEQLYECGAPGAIRGPHGGLGFSPCPQCRPVGPDAPLADGPGDYEVVVEARVRVSAGSRQFARLRAVEAVGAAFGPNGPERGRVVARSARKVDGPEFGGDEA